MVWKSNWTARFSVCAIGIVVCFTDIALAVQSPNDSSLSDGAVADRCRQLLETSVFDFYYPHSIDPEHGGYLEALDGDGKFVATDKFLTLQARQLWFFSTCAVHGVHQDKSLAAAKSGYDFVQSHFRDSDHGGYFVATKRTGEPVDRRKHVYPLSFLIYGFVEYHRATGLQEPLDQAMALFETLEQHCHDGQNGGYNEVFSDDWNLITDTSQWGVVGAVGTKTYNSHLHLLESFTQLYLETRDVRVRERLESLVLINTVTVRHPDYPCNIDAWTPDWKMVETEKNLRASFGHDVECVWLVLEANKALGRAPGVLRNWAVSMCEHALDRGWDRKNHGLFYSAPVGKPSDDRKKEWWTQSEAMVSMLTMSRLTGDDKYRKRFDQTLDFIERHQVAESGGWWATVSEDGSPGSSDMRASKWKGAYHDGRALLLSEQLLRQPPGRDADSVD